MAVTFFIFTFTKIQLLNQSRFFNKIEMILKMKNNFGVIVVIFTVRKFNTHYIIMKKSLLLFAAAGLTVFTAFKLSVTHENKPLEIGEKAPMVSEKMKDVSNNDYSLSDLKKENGLLVIFSCNTCPFVIGGMGDSEGWEGRYNEVFDHATAKGVGMVLVNSNEAKREKGDSFEDMQNRWKEKELKSPYVLDVNNKLADAFGARTTPHVYLFDKDMKLVYVGAIDDNVNSSKEVKEHYLKSAITQLAAGKKINPNQTKNMGCSIKRVEH